MPTLAAEALDSMISSREREGERLAAMLQDRLTQLAALSAHALADGSAPVTAVTLYPGSASVVRTAQVAAGATQVVITGLPAQFNTQTLRVDAGPGIRVGEIVTQDAANVEAINPAEAALAGKIEALRDQQAALDAEIKAADIVRAYLERYQSAAPDKQNAVVDAKSLAAVIDTLGRGASDALVKVQRLNVQKRDLTRKIEVMERDMARLRSGARDTRSVTIKLAASKAGTLNLSYQVNSAGWKPGYRAALDSASATVDLERLASIAQKTGEDWSNVKLTLSTAQPRQSPVGPEPQPWLLTYIPPQPVSAGYASAPPPAAAPVMQRMEVSGRRSIKAGEDFAPPTFETQSTFATEFEVPGRVSLASDGREVSVMLAQQSLPVHQYLRVTPRLDKSAVVMADAERPQGVWPAGNMQLFRDGGYIGSTQWQLNDAERAVFSFGRDDLVKVSLNQVKGKTGSTGFFEKRSEKDMADVFTIHNGHKSAVELLVLESSPVSTSDEVKVRSLFEPKPTVEAWEQRRGVVAWKRQLAPNESANFNVSYSFEYPKEGYVAGMR